MPEKVAKLVIVPIDGSKNALLSLDYLSHLFGADTHLKVMLCYILPSLPPILVEESRKDVKMAKKLTEVETKHTQMAERILDEAKTKLVRIGFREDRIQTRYQKKKIGAARDICHLAENKRVDAIVIATRGKSSWEAFFMGETASKVLEFHQASPVWMIKGKVGARNILIAVDSSNHALKAADHAASMLSGTDCRVCLFHSKRHLRRFVPKEVFETAPELEDLWKQTAGKEIEPYITKAKDKLRSASIDESRISVKVVDGTRNPAADILKEAKSSGCGSIVLGRKGKSDVKDFSMGDVTRKVLSDALDMALWIVP